MKRKKAGKALEAVARAINDSDEFVTHVAGIAALYRRERELAGAESRRELRQSLKTLQRHADALDGWLKQAQAGNRARPGQAALKLIDARAGDSTTARVWIARAAEAAAHTIDDLKSNGPDPADAVRSAAEALKATFEHHKLKWSTSLTKDEVAPALRLICAIARDAGDRTLTPVDARKALQPARTR